MKAKLNSLFLSKKTIALFAAAAVILCVLIAVTLISTGVFAPDGQESAYADKSYAYGGRSVTNRAVSGSLYYQNSTASLNAFALENGSSLGTQDNKNGTPVNKWNMALTFSNKSNVSAKDNERAYLNVTCTFNGVPAYLINNGAAVLEFEVSGSSPSHGDTYFYMLLVSTTDSAVVNPSSGQWGDMNRGTIYKWINSYAKSGTGSRDSFTLNIRYGARDTGKALWDAYDTDSDICSRLKLWPKFDNTAPQFLLQSTTTTQITAAKDTGTGTVTYNGNSGLNAPSKGAKVLTINITDNMSGVHPYRLATFNDFTPSNTVVPHILEQGNFKITSRTVSGSSATIKVTASANGTFYLSTYDLLGNKRTQSFTVNGIDSSAPNISTKSQSIDNWTNGNVTLRVKATDSPSGVQYIQFDTVSNRVYNTNSPLQTSATTYRTDPDFTASYTVSANKDVSITTMDRVGNLSGATIHSVTNIDKEAPTISTKMYKAGTTTEVTGSSWVNCDVDIVVTVKDTGSKVWKVSMLDATGLVASKKTINGTTTTGGAAKDVYYDAAIGAISTQGKLPTATSGFAEEWSATFTVSHNRAYKFEVYDHANNYVRSDEVKPPIDKTGPTFSGVNVTGTNGLGESVNAINNYASSNLTVTIVSPSDPTTANVSGSGGLHGGAAKMEIYYSDASGNPSSLVTSTAWASGGTTLTLTENTAQRPNGYVIRVSDNVGNYSTYYRFIPLKDSVTPTVASIGGHMEEWTNESSHDVTTNISFGKSGGSLFMEVYSLNNDTGAVNVQQGSNGNGTSEQTWSAAGGSTQTVVAQNTQSVGTQGIQYYYFKAVSGAQVSSEWYGANAEKLGTDISTDAKFADGNFTGNGTRVMLDRTSPELTSVRYETAGGEKVDKDSLTSPVSYFDQSVTGYFLINDSLGNKTVGINGSGGTATAAKSWTVEYEVYYKDAGGTKYYNYTSLDTNRTESFPSYSKANGSSGEEAAKSGIEILTTHSYSDITAPKGFGSGSTTVDAADRKTIALLKMTNMYAFNMKYTVDSGVIVPMYLITVTDVAGNSATIEQQLYIDSYRPTLSKPDPWDYRFGEWTNYAITMWITKSFGMSGSKIYYYFDTTLESSVPPLDDVRWTEMSDSEGILRSPNAPYETASRIDISSDSKQGNLFFMVKSGAGRAAALVNPYLVKQDSTPPESLGYEFFDEYNKLIPADSWSSTNVRMQVTATDGDGAGIIYVRAVASDNRTEYEFTLHSTKGNITVWQSEELLPEDVYTINIADNVFFDGGQPNRSTFDSNNPEEACLYITHKPKIDATVPTLTVGQNGSYEKGYVDIANNSYVWAKARNANLTINLSTTAVKSGGQIYYMKRDLFNAADISDYVAKRYTLGSNPRGTDGNIYIADPESEGWTLLPGGTIQSGSAAAAYLVVGAENEVWHYGYDFIVVSNSGLASYVDYGSVFVDREAPQLIFNKSYYEFISGGMASGVIPDENGNGSWTNSSVNASLFISDGSGSGISSVRVYKGSTLLSNPIFAYDSVYAVQLADTAARRIKEVLLSADGGNYTLVNPKNYAVVDGFIRFYEDESFAVPSATASVKYIDVNNKTFITQVTKVTDTNANANGFYKVLLDEYALYTIVYTDNAGNTVQFKNAEGNYTDGYKVMPMIDPVTPIINSSTDITAYTVTSSDVRFVTGAITVSYIISYGVSAFGYNEARYNAGGEPINIPKGNELYTFEYSVDGGNTYTRILPGTAKTETNAEGVTFAFVSQNTNEARYEITYTADQKQRYTFRVKNGVEYVPTDINGQPTGPATECSVDNYIKIDNTAPSVSNAVYSIGSDRWTGDYWYYNAVTMTVRLAGNDIGDIDTIIGSGLYYIKITKYDVVTNEVIATDSKNGQSLDGSFAFTLDGYYRYHVEFADNLGNYGEIAPFVANIDLDRFVDGDITVVARKDDGSLYQRVDGFFPWSSSSITYTVTTKVLRSGQLVQYTFGNNDTDGWITLDNGIIPANSGWASATSTVTFADTMQQRIRFRVISNAAQNAIANSVPIKINGEYNPELIGTYMFYEQKDANGNSYTLETKIDKVTPEFFDQAYYTSAPSDLVGAKNRGITATANGVEYVAGTWTQHNVVFIIKVKNSISGSLVELSTDNGQSWSSSAQQIGNMAGAASTSATFTVTVSIDSTNFRFRVVSGSGLSSEYIRTTESGTETGFGIVNIDQSAINISTVYRYIAEEDVVRAYGVVDYAQTWAKASSNPYSLNTWTPYYVIVEINTRNVGKSGATLWYSDESGIYKDGTTKTASELAALKWLYNGINIYNRVLSQETNYSYMLLTENQSKTYSFRTISGAAKIADSTGNGSVKIDKDAPFMTINLFSGEKSVKWTSDNVADMHKWFVSDAVLNFKAASINGQGKIVHTANASGYTVSYQAYYLVGGNRVYVDASGNSGYRNEQGKNDSYTATNWINIAEISSYVRLSVPHNKNNPLTFVFRITSGAGLSCYMTEAFAGDTSNGMDYPWIKALSSDNPGEFTINVDTTDYSVDVAQMLKEYADAYGATILPGVNENSMAAIEVTVNGTVINNPANYQSQKNTVYKAKRGDEVSVKLVANGYDDAKGFGYIYKRMEYYGTMLDESGNSFVTVGQTSPKVEATSNTVSFSICDSGIFIKGYFTKEISIGYANLVQYLQQSDGVLAVTVSSPYSVSQLAFRVSYTGKGFAQDGSVSEYIKAVTVPKLLGKYSVLVEITNDNASDPSYKLRNAESSSLELHYFNEMELGAGTTAYGIYSSTDFGYINIYSLSGQDSTALDFLGANRKTAHYVQMGDISFNGQFAPISGTFAGTYNGNNYCISIDNIVTQGNFGIFNAVSGTVESLGVRINSLTVDNAQNVGFVAGSLRDAGRIVGCYAIGSMYVSGSGVNVGGIVGYVENGSLVTNLTDISLSNKGKAFAGYAGGVAGYVTGGTSYLYQNYTVTPIEIYNVAAATVQAGGLVGGIHQLALDITDENYYLRSNTFINESIASDNNGVGQTALNIAADKINAEVFETFVTETEMSRVYISSNIDTRAKTVKTLINGRVQELGMEQGNGTVNNPFRVTSSASLEFIDKYPGANYVQTSDIIIADGETFKTIAAHKVFTGTYNGEYNQTKHTIENITIDTTDNVAGIFGKVAGTIKNLDIRGLTINVNYAGTNEVNVGAVTANLLSDGVNSGELNSVYVLGNIYVSAPNASANVGGVVGTASNAKLTDILSLANVKTENTATANVGGTVGTVKDNSTLSTIISLARVEGSFDLTGNVGAIIGAMDVASALKLLSSEYRALTGNTYRLGLNVEYAVGYIPYSPEVKASAFSGQIISFTALRTGSDIYFSNGTKLSALLESVYPLSGQGTSDNPFLVTTVEDFLYISDFLYASFRLTANLDFSGYDIEPIGMGAKFTGSISGLLSLEEQEDNTRTYSITGLTNAFVYHNAGLISNLRLSVNYTNTSINGEFAFGAVAMYNSGDIQNVVAEGQITIKSVGTSTVSIGGLVGVSLGGTIGNSGDYAAIVSSMTGINITVNASVVDVGGVVGSVKGATEFNYIVSNGAITAYGITVRAGTLGGAVYYGAPTVSNNIKADASIHINGVNAGWLENEEMTYRLFGLVIAD